MNTRLLFLHALSPLHAGTGQSVGAIELAIARDCATGYPYLPGSSLKGSLRDRSEAGGNEQKTRSLFGPPTEQAAEHAGALIVGDANLLLLPVRSVAGTFAWVTSPYLLRRCTRDALEIGFAAEALPKVPSPSLGDAQVTGVCSLKAQFGGKERVIFEDLDLLPAPHPDAQDWAAWIGARLFPGDAAWAAMLTERFCIVHDDVMGFFSQHATDVVARVALKRDTKTVENLWHEESLPVESVLLSVIGALPNVMTGLSVAQLLEEVAKLTAAPLQVGGKATVGRGRCRLVLVGEEG
ncbi:MAG: type III-B CRISPR module RAMP protein Cmr4 [Myxococcota bacterium]|jgi:CRISPR-associated protein Cmr4|nr:type III-B CRISPR module RAMP protein Cmr4 [Myxococcota bacterium]